MRFFPPPLSVILPPPSMTTGPVSLNTFAVAATTIVAGAAPQSNVMAPPFATAATNASDVQLAAVPSPMTVFALVMLSACASAGTAPFSSAVSAGGPAAESVGGPPLDDEPAPAGTSPSVEQASTRASTTRK